jgi:hypothetical protein
MQYILWKRGNTYGIDKYDKLLETNKTFRKIAKVSS